MNKKHILVILLVFVFVIIFGQVLFAMGDVGNAGSGSYTSSSSGSSDGSLFWIIYFIMSLPFPLNLIFIGFLFLAVITAKNKKQDFSGNRANNNFQNIIKDEQSIINKIRHIDPNFSKYTFATYAKQMVIEVQESTENANVSHLVGNVAPDFYQLLNRQVQESASQGVWYHQGQEIIDLSYQDFIIKDGYEYLIVEAFVSEYLYCLKDQTVISGNMKRRQNRGYQMVFKRELGVITNNDLELKTTNCLKCGAPNSIDQQGMCSHCQNIVNSGKFGFVLVEYKQVVEKMSLYYQKYNHRYIDYLNDEAHVVNQIKLVDSTFDLEQFESFVSKSFLAVQDAWEKRDMKLIRNYESSDLFLTHQQQILEFIKNDTYPRLDDQKIRDINVNVFEVDGNFEYITVIVACQLKVFVLDKDGNTLYGGNKSDQVKGYKLRYKRMKGVTKLNTDISACPNCGASLSVSDAGNCDYCGSMVTKGEHGWIMDSYEAVRKLARR